MSPRGKHDYPEDMFADTRMSLGDHIQDLRSHMLRAIYGFLIGLTAGFAVAPSVLKVIQAPVQEQLREFHDARFHEKLRVRTEGGRADGANRPKWVRFDAVADLEEEAGAGFAGPHGGKPVVYSQALARARRLVARAETLLQQERLAEVEPLAPDLQRAADTLSRAAETPDEHQAALPVVVAGLRASAERLAEAVRDKNSAKAAEALAGAEEVLGRAGVRTLWLRLNPLDVVSVLHDAQQALDPRDELVSLSILESCMAYIKVSVVCGLVLASPWIFYQIWSFVAAGLYPHERRYINVYLPLSIVLFLAGVLMAQFYMMPKVVQVLLWFNRWLGQEPMLRLSDWLGFALLVPALTGLCFEVPVVMLFMERTGLVTTQWFIRHWKAALFTVHVIAVIGPAVDPISMEIVALPMFALYWLGILLCHLRPRETGRDTDVPEPGEPVEV